jgi:carbonic anhydrase/acetyltransferase-like protein (isoleucine patch superfamily)
MKYKLAENPIKFGNKTLFQIQALKDFSDVKAGDLGGYIEQESNLSQEGSCWIYHNAKVYGSAEVSGNAIVCNNAKVYDDVRVGGNARVFNYAEVYHNAKVFDNAIVYDNAEVYHNAKIYGNAIVSDNAKIYGDALVYGSAEVFGNATVSDDAIVSDNAIVGDSAIVSGSAKFGGYAKVCDSAEVYNYIFDKPKPKIKQEDKQQPPKHYDLTIQPIDYIIANNLNFAEGNIIKYVSRYKQKNGKEDLLKARYYLDLLIKEIGE